ncbi:enoyl-CoA hydratase-related protein [Streptomyces sp. NPDC015492]|uniref:enoyl-CoA hydratase-related protein n=1 Tax=Streptomyces sp. NPDC015492 TaxID=3364958 RepID=UPI0036FE4688
MTTPAHASLLVERLDDILVITLNRPRARNALDIDTARALDGALSELYEDSSLRVGVVTGAGGYFCAGMDLKKFPVDGVPVVADRGLGGLTRADPPKPLIAAVEGAAVGGGLELALACDLIVAGSGAVLALPEVTRGLIPAEGGAVRLPHRLPYHLAMEMLLTGAPLSAGLAGRHGLVNRVVPDGEALDEALSLARLIAGHPPEAVRAIRSIARSSQDGDTMAPWRLQDSLATAFFAPERPRPHQGDPTPHT